MAVPYRRAMDHIYWLCVLIGVTSLVLISAIIQPRAALRHDNGRPSILRMIHSQNRCPLFRIMG
jgi:hypothetical protein